MHHLPPELVVFFTSMIPVFDYKLGIPLGIKMGLSAMTSTLFAVCGSFIPCMLILIGLRYLSDFLRKKSKFADHYLTKLFSKTQDRHGPKFEKYGDILLLLAIIIPLPGSGPGTATLIAFVFGINFWRAMGFIALGTMISGAMITGGVTSILALTKLFH